MANITPVQPIDLQSEIADWQSAVYGEEVRGAAVSALQKIQGTVNDTVTNVNQAAEDAAQAVEDISGAITQTQENAQAAAGSAEAAAGSASAAETSKSEAATSASNAAASAEAAAESAEKAAQVEGFDGTAATVKATDTYGLVASALGESNVQALIDAIANRVINQLVNKSQIINNLLATQPGNVLDAVQGAALKGLIDQNTADIAQLNSDYISLDQNLKNGWKPNGTSFYKVIGNLALVRFYCRNGVTESGTVIADGLPPKFMGVGVNVFWKGEPDGSAIQITGGQAIILSSENKPAPSNTLFANIICSI